ncbi:winged helix-turn-helix domain-containing protein [Pelagibacterium montanilacus]|uniref:winged helix-turn-helix domain-containing protein n=1 Tax=Pelagibacterium montanilacus TaxID=2185280 RepID=UPI0013DF1E8A|nr:helix-turn-helix domain-containing protein [Pelagibacterium montanilacus]
MLRCHDLVIATDMLTARRDDGTRIEFTRHERALLMCFLHRPGTLLTRARLINAIGRDAGEIGERNIDYLINRLRKRLGDTARKSRFIVTQYGEGYYWAATPKQATPLSAFLVIGPVFGLDARSSVARDALAQLATAIASQTGDGKAVRLEPDWRFDPRAVADIAYTLEIGTHEDGEEVHLALTLRRGRTGQAIANFRHVLPSRASGERIAELSRLVLDAVWAHEAIVRADDVSPTDRPAHLRMHDAAVTLTDDPISWRENAARLKAAHGAEPGDPRLAVMLALNHYARLIQSLGEIQSPLSDSDWCAFESEIETLALGALPELEDDPQMLLAIAKLLRFIDRGHLDLAARLTDRAFRTSTAFAAAFSMKAQISASHGAIDTARTFYNKAIELAEPGSEFDVYLTITKATAMQAANRRREVDLLADRLFTRLPAARSSFGLFFVSPRAETLAPDQDEAIAHMPAARCRHLTDYLFRVSARQFTRRQHRRNVMRGLVRHVTRHHGPAAIAPIVARTVPELVASPGRD